MNIPLFRALCGVLTVLSCSVAAGSEDRSDYLLFLTAAASDRAASPSMPRHKEKETALTFVYTAEVENYRFLTELHAADAGEEEIARLQLGWRFAPRATLWAGRFHNPQGYWNTQYHHGSYLQTAIGRPAIEEFDDHDGVLPSHFTGAQLDGTLPTEGAGLLRYELAFGRSGTLHGEGLESPDLIGPHRHGGTTASLRLAYHPTEGEADAAGIFLGRNRLPTRDMSIQEVRQTVSGFFGNWENEKIRIFGAVFFLQNELEEASVVNTGRFTAGYLQAEYRMNTPWTLYVRGEQSRGTKDDPYLALFDEFAKCQTTVGARWDVARKQALKFEYSHPQIMGEFSRRLAAEWSMVLP
jgi:hypothetical protein